MSRTNLSVTLALALLWAPPLLAECSSPFSEQSDAVSGKVTQVDFRENEGSVRIEATTDGSARWSVRYCVDGWFGPSASELDGVKATVENSGGKLRIGTDIPSGVDEDDVVPHWTVSIPASASLQLEMGAGDISVTGIAGGVEINASVGDVEVDVPAGALEIDVGVGDITATWGPGDYGSADADANVGDARLSVGGRNVDVAHAPGPGHRIGLHGSGKGPSLSVEVNVGDASLRIR
jgi:hypothetical protein